MNLTLSVDFKEGRKILSYKAKINTFKISVPKGKKFEVSLFESVEFTLLTFCPVVAYRSPSCILDVVDCLLLLMQNTLFIAGTDTDAGKTVVTSALAAYWQTYHHDQSLAIMKPLQSGIGDRETYQSLFSLGLSPEQITPQYFSAPLAPPIAAAKENRPIDLGLVWQELQNLRTTRDFVLVEALGGLGSPVTDELTVADIAGEWRLPTVLVVPVRLGAISQAVANVALARQTKVNLRGIILNCTQPLSNEDIENLTPIGMIQRLTNIPIYGCLPYLDNPRDLSKLTFAASGLELERIFPLS